MPGLNTSRPFENEEIMGNTQQEILGILGDIRYYGEGTKLDREQHESRGWHSHRDGMQPSTWEQKKMTGCWSQYKRQYKARSSLISDGNGEVKRRVSIIHEVTPEDLAHVRQLEQEQQVSNLTSHSNH